MTLPDHPSANEVLATAASFYQEAPGAIKHGLATFAGVLALVWTSMTSWAAAILAFLFLCDLLLGVFAALYKGGIEAFDDVRFWRGFVKLGVAMVGIGLFTLGDLLLEVAGVPEQWDPLTTATITGMAWGFFWSGVRNFAVVFPASVDWINGAIRRIPRAALRFELEQKAKEAELDEEECEEEPEP